MLNDLKTFGISENYFEIKRIGDFVNSREQGFSHIDIEAINFDETTKILCTEQDQPAFKSCDALDIVDSKNKINFIEFKQFKDREDMETLIEKYELPQKIKESNHVLIDIIKKRNFVHKNKMKKYYSYEKNVIISFNLTDNPRKKIAALFRISTIMKMIEKQFHNNYIEGENFNEPVCIRMVEFNTAYLKYA